MLKPIDFSIREGYAGAPKRRQHSPDLKNNVTDTAPKLDVGVHECRVKLRMEGENFDDFKVRRSLKISELTNQIKAIPSISEHPMILIKIFAGGQLLRGSPESTLEELGVEPASNLLVICTDAESVHKLDSSIQNSMSDRIRTIEDEEALELLRRSGPTTKARPKTGEIQDWGFARIEPLRIDPMTAAPYQEPPPEDAQKLLEQLAADNGIQAIMKKYHWRVGLLTEIPPMAETGLVGLSNHCLLGLNKNRGEVSVHSVQQTHGHLSTHELRG
jgi:hypothetical protein